MTETPGEDSAHSSAFLPIAEAASAAILVDNAGLPVWPVEDDAEAALFRLLASRSGCSVAIVTAKSGRSSTIALRGVVASLGSEALGCAELFAHLSRRRCIGALTPESLSSRIGEDIAVVVALSPDVSPELLEVLRGLRSARGAPGLIFAPSKKELQTVVRLRAASLRLAPQLPSRDALAHASIDFRDLDLPDRKIIGRRTLALPDGGFPFKGTNILGLTTHGDGIDASLGDGRVFCAVPRLVDDGTSTNQPPACVLRNRCYRLDLSFSDLIRQRLHVDPTNIEARVFFFATCWGINAEPAYVDYEWSVIRALQLNPMIGAVVTTWKITVIEPWHVEEFYRLLRSTRTVGLAVQEFNDKFSESSGIDLCVVGDPDIAVTRDCLPVQHVDWSEVDKKRVATGSLQGRIQFPAAYLRLVGSALRPELGEIHNKATEAASAIQLRLLEGLYPSEDLRRAFHESWGTLLAWRGTLPSRDWLALSLERTVSRNAGTCFVCRATVERHDFSLDLPYPTRRSLFNCPRCGIVADTTRDILDCSFTFDINDSMLHRAPSLQSEAINYSIESDWRGRRTVHQWASRDGAFESSVALPEALSAGFHYVTVFDLLDYQFSAFRFPFFNHGTKVRSTSR